jgi:putative phosphoribosyl transferase
MPVQSDAGKGPQRPDRTGTRIRARRVPEALATDIGSPEHPVGVVILPVTVPLSASSGGLRRVAAGLRDRGFATFLAELLSPAEMEHGYHNFDFDMLAGRIAEITESLHRKAPFEDLPIGYFGTSTDAAAMAIAAAQPGCRAGALVMCDARPDLASIELPRVHAPTLFIVEDDELALDLTRRALAKLGSRGDLAILRGMGKGLASPEIASDAARLGGDWFETHLRGDQDS